VGHTTRFSQPHICNNSKCGPPAQVKLQFSRFVQQNQDIVSLDLSDTSQQIGTEVSGMLGFSTLRRLEVKIDYRDGLVDFSYNPNRF
jgi:hypothetical protein